MDIKWILLIIFAVVWVIGNVIRSQQEEPRTPPARRPPNRNPNPGSSTASATNRPAPPPVSDIDRFLQEIDRLRRRDAGEPVVAEAPKPKPPPPPRPAPPPPPPPPTTTKQRPAATTGGRTAKQAKTAKMAKPTPKQHSAPTAPSSGKRAPGDLALELTLPEPESPESKSSRVEAKFLESAAPAPTPVPAGSGGSPKFPELKHESKPIEGSPAELLVALLRSQKGMPIAFVLREILSEPKCKRPPGAPPQQA